MTKVASFVAGSVVMGVGLYYNMSSVIGAGLMAIVYPVGTALRHIVDRDDERYYSEHRK